MIAFEIKHIKDFMQKLLLTEQFDSFLVSEISITTFVSFHITGDLFPEFFETEKVSALKEEERTFARWAEIKPFCLSVIRGERTPLSFHMVFSLPHGGVRTLIRNSGVSVDPEKVRALFMNCRFHGGQLLITSGVSYSEFTLDKSLERIWDQNLTHFLNKLNLS
jgi:hypothetical protein